jgi:hypothetical protein
VFVIDAEVPAPDTLEAGCYLVKPPRVGLDGRLLREMADRREVPAIVLVREPRTRAGLWPVVALGPVTVRTPVPPPTPEATSKRPAGGKGKKALRAPAPADPDGIIPSVAWFLDAGERLGDAGLASMDPNRHVIGRVEDLLMRVAAHPDHEKLHQALAAACRDAARLPGRERRIKPTSPLDDDDALEDGAEGSGEDGGGERASDDD